MCYEQLIITCNVIYFVKCFWSSNFVYICFIILYSVSGLTAYKEFYTSISNNCTIFYIFPVLPRFWISQLCQPAVFNLNSRIWNSTVRSETDICKQRKMKTKRNHQLQFTPPALYLMHWLCLGILNSLIPSVTINYRFLYLKV